MGLLGEDDERSGVHGANVQGQQNAINRRASASTACAAARCQVLEGRRSCRPASTSRRPRRRRGTSRSTAASSMWKILRAVLLGQDQRAARVGEQRRRPRCGRKRTGAGVSASGSGRSGQVEELRAVLGLEAAQLEPLERRLDVLDGRARPSWRCRPCAAGPEPGQVARDEVVERVVRRPSGGAEPVLGEPEEVRAAPLPRARRRDADQVDPQRRCRGRPPCRSAPRSPCASAARPRSAVAQRRRPRSPAASSPLVARSHQARRASRIAIASGQ